MPSAAADQRRKLLRDVVELEPARALGILVTYRRPADLKATLRSLSAQSRVLDHLLVVDNGPPEDAREIVAGESQGAAFTVDYVSAGGNLGPAGGIALGMSRLLGQALDSDWFVVLDDDNPPRLEDAFEHLLSFAEAMAASGVPVGAVGMAGARMDRSKARLLPIPDEVLNGPVTVDYIGGGQVLIISVRAVRDVGSFDSSYFFGFDDLEYGLRLRRGGWRLVCDGPYVRQERERSGTLGHVSHSSRNLSAPSWRDYYTTRNLLRILITSGDYPLASKVAMRALAKPIINFPTQPIEASSRLFIATRAVFDALWGRMGKRLDPEEYPYGWRIRA